MLMNEDNTAFCHIDPTLAEKVRIAKEQNMLQITICGEHFNRIIGCCRDCKDKPVCDKCVLSSHKDHNVSPLNEIVIQNRIFLNRTLEVLDEKRIAINSGIDKVNLAKSNLDTMVNKAIAEVMEVLVFNSFMSFASAQMWVILTTFRKPGWLTWRSINSQVLHYFNI